MTPEEQIIALQERVAGLEQSVSHLSNSSLFELAVDRTLQAIGYIKANRKIDTAVPLPGTFTLFLANSSGGAVTHSITFKDGIITAIA